MYPSFRTGWSAGFLTILSHPEKKRLPFFFRKFSLCDMALAKSRRSYRAELGLAEQSATDVVVRK